ncbi:hypothetical protein GE061_000025 [Apolygus lucorum]|uniref:SWIM-type domain-containing protein n=1 Tax=Apolygus lucorum TaxID=248454 RepID=A0A8S9Y4E0_APOLU|nr:hypothetical protein GE061_000025 [Apolygus lucorum]
MFDGAKCLETPTLIHYVGSLEGLAERPHGKNKLDERPHVRTAVSQIEEQKKKIDEQPKKLYRKLCTSAQSVPPNSAAVLLPRNVKQVKNTVYQERLRRLVSQDDVYALYLLAHHETSYVRRLQLSPEFMCTLYSDTIKKEYDRIRNIDTITLYYVTTFNLGDFYVSPLVMRHELFKQCPSIPLAYHVHEAKTTTTHESFFRVLNEQGWDMKNRIIVTDRESSIRKGIRQAIPTMRNLVCWNHIQQDVKNWVLKSLNNTPDDVKVYVSHVWDLLDSNSESEQTNKLEKMSSQWSAPFLQYFNQHLKRDVKNNAKWVLEELGVYTPQSGITINPSESVNALLKRLLDNQEVLLQSLVLSLFNLDLSFCTEILRGLCGHGDYSLKPMYEEFGLEINEAYAEMPKSKPIDVSQMPQIWQDKFKFPKVDQEPHIPYSLDNLAKQIVLGGRIQLLPEHGGFVISGTKETHLVKLSTRDGKFAESCTCKARKCCHHVHAAYQSIVILKDTKVKKKNAYVAKKNQRV